MSHIYYDFDSKKWKRCKTRREWRIRKAIFAWKINDDIGKRWNRNFKMLFKNE